MRPSRALFSKRFFLMLLVYCFLYLPLLVLIIFSFNDSKYSVVWKAWTWQWYERLWHNTSLIDATLNSLFVAFLAATAATLLGTLTALALHRYRFTGRKFLQSSLFVLMVSPDIVMGVSLLILFLGLGLKPGFCTLLLAHIAICLPFVTATVYARLLGFDEHLVEAAQDLGASEAQAFRYIIFPLLIPGIVAGWLLSFTLSMDDVIVSFFTTGPGFEILPLQIYSMVRLGVKPDVNALSALMICVTSICVLTAQILIRRKK